MHWGEWFRLIFQEKDNKWLHQVVVPWIYTVLWLLVFFLFLLTNRNQVKWGQFTFIAGVVESFLIFLLETMVTMWDLRLAHPYKRVSLRTFSPYWIVQLVMTLFIVIGTYIFCVSGMNVLVFSLILLVTIYKYMNCRLSVLIEKEKPIKARKAQFSYRKPKN